MSESRQCAVLIASTFMAGALTPVPPAQARPTAHQSVVRQATHKEAARTSRPKVVVAHVARGSVTTTVGGGAKAFWPVGQSSPQPVTTSSRCSRAYADSTGAPAASPQQDDVPRRTHGSDSFMSRFLAVFGVTLIAVVGLSFLRRSRASEEST